MGFIKRQSVEKFEAVTDSDEREQATKTAKAAAVSQIPGCCGEPDECGGCDSDD